MILACRAEIKFALRSHHRKRQQGQRPKEMISHVPSCYQIEPRVASTRAREARARGQTPNQFNPAEFAARPVWLLRMATSHDTNTSPKATPAATGINWSIRSEEHTSELQ